MAIKTFKDKATAAAFMGLPVKALPPSIRKRVRTRLAILNRARRLEDLRVPPGNRLEALQGDRNGQYSIRINQQWRVCFVWRAGDVFEVEILDYHH